MQVLVAVSQPHKLKHHDKNTEVIHNREHIEVCLRAAQLCIECGILELSMIPDSNESY